MSFIWIEIRREQSFLWVLTHHTGPSSSDFPKFSLAGTLLLQN